MENTYDCDVFMIEVEKNVHINHQALHFYTWEYMYRLTYHFGCTQNFVAVEHNNIKCHGNNSYILIYIQITVSWYPIHVEQLVRNSNRIARTGKKIRRSLVSDLFNKIVSCFRIFDNCSINIIM